jgi:GTP cyclohydrolase I
MALAAKMLDHMQKDGYSNPKVYGVPRGGISVAYLCAAYGCHVTDSPLAADVIVDDLVDSGKTKAEWKHNTKMNFYALCDYMDPPKNGDWIVFPWEESSSQTNEEDIILRLLQYVGEDPNREGLEDTPKRVLKAWKHWTSGYDRKPEEVLKVFKDGAKGYQEMIVESPIPFFSMCEHHMAPFFGTASIGYIPDELGICGLSKIPRVLDIFARRLQVQERLTVQTADALVDLLKPYGVGVVIKARHLCMESRGIQQAGVYTTTSAMRGAFLEKERVRHEFLTLIK